MANSLSYKDKLFSVGDTVEISYKIKEGDKVRQQLFRGILINIKGANEALRMITIRKVSHSGIGVERVIPIASPHLTNIKLIRKSSYRKAKLYFIRDLSDKELRSKLYK